ncbi:MAG: hypothetical protein LBE31_06130, partial [Deltaproteobacteria bacterium]|nr:hypothetical protein [Deltaproteobacteria bacterium]
MGSLLSGSISCANSLLSGSKSRQSRFGDFCCQNESRREQSYQKDSRRKDNYQKDNFQKDNFQEAPGPAAYSPHKLIPQNLVLVLIIFLSIFFMPSSPSRANVPSVNFATLSSYRDIPGVTSDEIEAIEALKAKNLTLILGSTISTESFIGVDGEPSGFN